MFGIFLSPEERAKKRKTRTEKRTKKRNKYLLARTKEMHTQKN